ncbi:MAG: hypothetical protein ABR865_03645 [Terracidiphilus sp.]|jgi:hypothetical protein
MLVVVILLVVALVWVSQTDARPERVSLFVAAVIGAVTAIYALFTYEMLLQNQTMAKAALDSSVLMERSLRFSQTASLLYETRNTKDPTFKSAAGHVTPIENEDYKRALTEFSEGGAQMEFVFAVVKNMGQGSATNLSIEASYNLIDSSNPNRESTVTKRASVPILESRKGVALCIFISKVPTPDDRVSLISAHLAAGDFYRDAIKELPQQVDIDPHTHHFERAADCVVRLA